MQVAPAPPKTTEKLSKLCMLHIRKSGLQEDARKLNRQSSQLLSIVTFPSFVPVHQKHIVIINEPTQLVDL